MYLISKYDILKVIVPPLLASTLFVIALFGMALPMTKHNLLDQKKETITLLTQAAVNVLKYYEKRVQSGELSLGEAQRRAVQQVRGLRYGGEDKDYFWISDLTPRMIMHPYRPELEGQNLATFTDPMGKHLFVEFVSTVKQQGGSGYVEYLWQLKDRADHIVPKLSFVKLFQPWGWVIGTGVYLEEVHAQFGQIARELVYISGAILTLIVLLSGAIIYQGLNETNRRLAAEKELEKYYGHLEELVGQRTSELTKALSEVKLLSGLLPICASCKKIRDDQGYWNQIESYIQLHSQAQFSHSICPECMQKLYPDFIPKQSSEKK
ncbi:MAG: cache domain-containing protein [Desulfobulbaceae bacterium]